MRIVCTPLGKRKGEGFGGMRGGGGWVLAHLVRVSSRLQISKVLQIGKCPITLLLVVLEGAAEEHFDLRRGPAGPQG